MITEIVSIPESLVSLIEKLQYEIAVKKKIIINILSNPIIEVNEQLFDSYHKELVNFSSQYEYLKSKIENEFIPKSLKEIPGTIEWNISFETNEMTCSVTVDDKVTPDETTISLTVLTEDVGLIQGIQYEVQVREGIITDLLSTQGITINDKLFRKYQETLGVYTAEYQTAQNNLVNNYIPNKYKGTETKLNWSLDFYTEKITFTEAKK